MATPVMVRDIPRLPPRPRDGHKGTFGKVVVVAGSPGMSGAAILAGTAALRGGAGLVQVVVPESIQAIVATAQPCYTTAALPLNKGGELLALVESADAVVMGPGMGQNESTKDHLSALVGCLPLPLVLDADALNVLHGCVNQLQQHTCPVVLTPHPGEFARLVSMTVAEVQSSRLELATGFARAHDCIVLLKGANTVVTDGKRVYVNQTGNPGMATGGSGDVLSGLLGALIGSGSLPAFEATVLGVYIHGLAGDLACKRLGETGMIATDILESLPAALLAHQGLAQESA